MHDSPLLVVLALIVAAWLVFVGAYRLVLG